MYGGDADADDDEMIITLFLCCVLCIELIVMMMRRRGESMRDSVEERAFTSCSANCALKKHCTATKS